MIDNNIMPTSGPREIDPVTLAKIKQKSQEREYEIIDDPIGRIKLKNYTSADSLLNNRKVYIYYCSLCGTCVLVTSFNLSGVPRRRTDEALIVVDLDSVAVQRYMEPGRSQALNRAEVYETQHTWVCKTCGVTLAYSSRPHTVQMLSEIVPPPNSSGAPQKSNLYILKNALCTDPKYSELFSPS